MQRSLALFAFTLTLLSGLPAFAKDTDTDHDGLDDITETSLGTDPNTRDTDADGLFDGAELDRFTNPLESDTDGGGMLDGDEISALQDPLNPDDDYGDKIGPGDFFMDCSGGFFSSCDNSGGDFSCDNGGGGGSCGNNNDGCSSGGGVNCSTGKAKNNGVGVYFMLGCVVFLRRRSYQPLK